MRSRKLNHVSHVEDLAAERVCDRGLTTGGRSRPVAAAAAWLPPEVRERLHRHEHPSAVEVAARTALASPEEEKAPAVCAAAAYEKGVVACVCAARRELANRPVVVWEARQWLLVAFGCEGHTLRTTDCRIERTFLERCIFELRIAIVVAGEEQGQESHHVPSSKHFTEHSNRGANTVPSFVAYRAAPDTHRQPAFVLHWSKVSAAQSSFRRSTFAPRSEAERSPRADGSYGPAWLLIGASEAPTRTGRSLLRIAPFTMS